MQFLVNMTNEQAKSYFDINAIISKANASMRVTPPHITDHAAPLSEGGLHDFYSNGDYWWQNPDTADGLPYIQRDGETNPDNFIAHRISMRQMRTNVVNLAAAYHVTKDGRYAAKAVDFLREFFLDEETKMNPNLLYAQAIPGICAGRGIGVIDTLHLVDVPVAVDILRGSDAMTEEIYMGLRQWFADYLSWMSTHKQGVDEMNAGNNHGVCWNAQAAMFAKFTENEEMMEFCRKRYTDVLLPNQLRPDGTFPEELRRTKPYNYSCFVVDNMVNICNILSTEDDNLWEFTLDDGRGIKKAVEFITPFMLDIDKWPYRKDVQHFEEFPAAMPFLIFAGIAYEKDECLELWARLAQKPQGDEIRRNIAVRQPYIWLVG